MGDPVHPSKPAYEDVASQGFGSWVSFSIEPKAHHGFQLVVLIGVSPWANTHLLWMWPDLESVKHRFHICETISSHGNSGLHQWLFQMAPVQRQLIH
ncbi:hypothetical protein EMGR_006195 [Emarellia grisea]|jgi:hypothetical protein